MMWAFIVFFIAGTRDAPPANDLTPLDVSRQAIGYFAFALLAMILVPVPLCTGHSGFIALTFDTRKAPAVDE